jgi:hypothetical protein
MKEETDFSIKSSYYPEYKRDDDTIHYYVEFNRGWKKDNFTIFQRCFIASKEDWAKMMGEGDKDSFAFKLMGREGHPYQLFSGFCKEECYPSPDWVKWLVDAMNEKVTRDQKEETVWKPK